MTNWKKLGLGLVTISVLGGCVDPGGATTEAGETIAEIDDAIINGKTASSADYLSVVAVYNDYTGLCSGTLIRREWVLTARHCVATTVNSQGAVVLASQMKVAQASSPGTSPPEGSSVGTKIVDDLRLKDTDNVYPDLALIRISPGLEGARMLYDGNRDDLDSATVRIMGFGMNSTTGGSGTLRLADVPVTGNAATVTFTLSANASGQITYHSDSGGPSLMFTDVLGRSFHGIAGVHRDVASTPPPTSGVETRVSTYRSPIKRRMFMPGGVNGPGPADIVLTGASGWDSIPVAFGNGSDETRVTFNLFNYPVANFGTWAALPNAKPLAGDFNGDGRSDVALTGVSGWTTIPVASSIGNGTFTVTNRAVSSIPALAATTGAKAVAGDYDGDGRDDIAVTGGTGWDNISVALSTGDGYFIKKTCSVADFGDYADTPGVKALAGDFDGDGRDDIALTGPSSWHTIPIAFSNGLDDDGACSFKTKNNSRADFPEWAADAHVTAVTGDFNGDGRDDIALTGGANWTTIPVALSKGAGSFTLTNNTPANDPGFSGSFPTLASLPGLTPVAGDFNADGRDDIALVGGSWNGIIVAVSDPRGDGGNFNIVAPPVANIAALAQAPNVIPLSNHNAR